MEDVLYTVEDIAEKLRLTSQTVRKLIRQKKIGSLKVNNSYRITQKQFDEYIENCSN